MMDDTFQPACSARSGRKNAIAEAFGKYPSAAMGHLTNQPAPSSEDKPAAPNKAGLSPAGHNGCGRAAMENNTAGRLH
jgi:hypothetical protein